MISFFFFFFSFTLNGVVARLGTASRQTGRQAVSQSEGFDPYKTHIWEWERSIFFLSVRHGVLTTRDRWSWSLVWRCFDLIRFEFEFALYLCT